MTQSYFTAGAMLKAGVSGCSKGSDFTPILNLIIVLHWIMALGNGRITTREIITA